MPFTIFKEIMNKNFLFAAFVGTIWLVYPLKPTYASDVTDTVVKVFVSLNRVDYYRPWQSKGTQSSVGSGVIIAGNRILTNAHVVSDETFIQVKKNRDAKKYTAKLEAIGHDCDLALLSVDDPNFFKGIAPIELGELPNRQDKVTVIGYPRGGDKLSITEGVVSRIEITSYSQSARNLLTVQIDAAINPGNSGGPVVQNGKLVGIAMQVFQSGQNIGYMIPPPVIEHFFNDLDDGNYDGFPILGIEYYNTESPSLRKFYNIHSEGGVLITRILPFSPADGFLEEGDVIFKIDDIAIGEDGTFKFRQDERLAMPYLITDKQINENVQMTIYRDGQKKDLSIPIKRFAALVPHPKHFEKPPYYIYGGLVFTVLSTDLLKSWGKRWWEKAPLDLKHYLIGKGRLNDAQNKDLVVLLNVLPDDINVGYHRVSNSIVAKVNDKHVESFKEFVQLLDEVKRQEEFTIIETEHRTKIILNNHNIDQINQEILKRNNIPSQFSDHVKVWLNESQ